MQLLDRLGELRNHLEQIADHAVVRDLEDRASLSLLIATITFDVRIPARCWIAPKRNADAM